MPNSPSSDDSSEDEATKQMLREATDQTLLTNAMFSEEKPAAGENVSNKSASIQPAIPLQKPQPNAVGRKSQRYLDTEEQRYENDLQVTESMQNFMHKKLNQLLEQRIEFVEVKVAKKRSSKSKNPAAVEPEPEEETFSLQLFKNSAPLVLRKDAIEPAAEAKLAEVTAGIASGSRQTKPSIKRRKLPSEVADEPKDADKLQAAVVSPEEIGAEVKSWAKRCKPHKEFNYKEHASKILYLVEPETEFTKQRKKHNWSESKIARK